MTDPPVPAATNPRPRPRISRGFWIALGLVMAWAAYLVVLGPSGPIDRLPLPQLKETIPGSPVDVPWTLHDLDGNPVDFASFRGKPVLLNFWATWCGPCVAEMPALARVAADPKMKHAAVVCVSVDGSREAPRRFVAGKGWTMTLLHASGPVPAAFQTDGIPTTFVLDPSGRIVASEVGLAAWDDPSVPAYFSRWAPPTR